jgi:hypothetical protein
MKVAIPTVGFKPINLMITIESKEELLNLWARLSESQSSRPWFYSEHVNDSDFQLLLALTKIKKEYNL